MAVNVFFPFVLTLKKHGYHNKFIAAQLAGVESSVHYFVTTIKTEEVLKGNAFS